ncbi:MAG: hypothetical protein Q9168_001287 [Polycauliona sp. 1 TL-2023]
MPPEPFCSHNVFIAWAARVLVAQLGARLTAYADTKASVVTLRLLAQKGGSTGLGALPGEVIELIAEQLRNFVFEPEIETWILRMKCLSNTCLTWSHLSSEDHWRPSDDDEEIQDTRVDIAYDRHVDTKSFWCDMLMSPRGNTKFEQRIQDFTRDFGIRPYFLVNKTWSDCYRSWSATAEAYLILPVLRAPIGSMPADDAATFLIKHSIDMSLLNDLSEDQRQKFLYAATVLKLHRYDKDENESELIEVTDEEEYDFDYDFDDDSSGEEKDKEKEAELDGDVDVNKDAAETGSLGSSKSPPQSNERAKLTFRKERIEPRLMLLGSTELKAGHVDNEY